MHTFQWLIYVPWISLQLFKKEKLKKQSTSYILEGPCTRTKTWALFVCFFMFPVSTFTVDCTSGSRALVPMVTNKCKLAAGSQRQHLAERVVFEEDRTYPSRGTFYKGCSGAGEDSHQRQPKAALWSAWIWVSFLELRKEALIGLRTVPVFDAQPLRVSCYMPGEGVMGGILSYIQSRSPKTGALSRLHLVSQIKATVLWGSFPNYHLRNTTLSV